MLSAASGQTTEEATLAAAVAALHKVLPAGSSVVLMSCPEGPERASARAQSPLSLANHAAGSGQTCPRGEIVRETVRDVVREIARETCPRGQIAPFDQVVLTWSEMMCQAQNRQPSRRLGRLSWSLWRQCGALCRQCTAPSPCSAGPSLALSIVPRDLRTLGSSDLQMFGFSDLGILGSLDSRILRSLDRRIVGSLDRRIVGNSNPRTFGPSDIRIFSSATRVLLLASRSPKGSRFWARV